MGQTVGRLGWERRTGRQSIELIDHQSHIVGPGNGEAAGAHQLGDALGVVVAQLGHRVQVPPGLSHGPRGEREAAR